MPIKEGLNEIRLDSAVFEIGAGLKLTKTRDNLQIKKRYLIENINFISFTANNGITLSSNNIQLGGNLVQNTVITSLGKTLSFDQSLINTQTGLLIATNALTTGTSLDINTSNNLLNSTNGVLRVINSSTSQNGVLVRLQSNSTSNSGITLLTNGKTGFNTLTPARRIEINEVAGTPPIRTTNMTSSSSDLTGTIKKVVVDSNGDFGVLTENQYNIRSVTTATTLVQTDYTIVYTVAGLTQTLPASVNKQIYNLKNGSTGNLTITGNIDGVLASTITIAAKNSLTLHGDGITWWVI